MNSEDLVMQRNNMGNQSGEKPYTFAGPDADVALKQLGGNMARLAHASLAGNQANVNDTLAKTSNAYQKGGIPAATGQYIRGTIADTAQAAAGMTKPILKPALALSGGISNFTKTLVTGDPTPIGAGKSSSSVQVKPALATRPQQTQTGNAPPEAIDYLKRNPHLHQAFQQKFGYLPDGFTPPALTGTQQQAAATGQNQARGGMVRENGISRTVGADGSITLTSGARGQDGYGMVKVLPGKPSGIRSTAAFQGLTGRATIPGANGAYSFQGSAADAVKFGAPVARPAPTRSMLGEQSGDYRDVRDRYEAAKAKASLATPQYLGPESGLGWKTRAKLYDTQMDAYNKATGNQTSMDIEAMREAGAGQRALLAASGEGERSALERQRLGMAEPGMMAETALRQGELSLKQAELSSMNDMAAARKNLTGLTPGTPEYSAAERKLATLSGKFGEQQKPTFEKLRTEGINSSSERLVQLNQDGTASEVRVPPSESALSAQHFILGRMDSKQRQVYLENMARTEPDLFDALVERQKARNAANGKQR